MVPSVTRFTGVVLLLLGVASGAAAQAQAPVVTAVSPARNALAAPRRTNVAFTFSQPLSTGTATQQALKVFSQQAGGKKAGTTTVSGNTLFFNPNTDFKPGETVLATVTAAAQSSGGQMLAQPQVFQFTTATAPSSGTFYGGQEVSVYSSPVGVTVGDVDNDGDLDLLTVNNGFNTVSVRPNNGDGTFRDRSNGNVTYEIPVGGNCNSLVLGDVDADGDLDFVVTTYLRQGLNGSVGIYLNDGRGQFSPGGGVSLGFSPTRTLLDDVDGDGDLDLVVSGNFTTSQLNTSVRLNNGNGTFSGGQDLPISSADLALGDVDSDGDLDLLTTTNGSNQVLLNLNNGQGAFAASQPVLAGAGPLVVGDVDNDGDLDLVAANANATVSVALNDGSGAFANSQTVAVGGAPSAQGLTLGDVDGDGDLDLLAANSNSTVSVRLNDGGGAFSGTQEVPAGNSGLTLGDVDNDGDLDLAVGRSNGATVSVLLNQAQPAPIITSLTPNMGQVGSTVVIKGDYFVAPISVIFNGMPATDLVQNSTTQLTVTVPAGASTGLVVVTTAAGVSNSVYFTVSLSLVVTTPPRNAPSVPRPTPVAVTLSQPLSNAVATQQALKVFSQQAGGLKAGTTTVQGNMITFTPATPFKAGETVQATVTAAAQTATGTPVAPQVFRFTTAAVPSAGLFGSGQQVSVGTQPRAAALGDVDGDGDLDLLTANGSANTVSVRLNNGAGTFTGTQDVPTGDYTYPISVALGDLDSDGDLDFVTANTQNGSVSVRLNNGRGGFGGTQNLFTDASNTNKVVLGDVDGDGDLDVLAVNTGSSGSLTVLLNNGTGTLSRGSTTRGNDNISDFAAGDVDGDGDLDLLVFSYTYFGVVSVYRNDGPGTFSTAPLMLFPSNGFTFGRLELGDLDKDGDLDLLLSGGDGIEVFANDGRAKFTSRQLIASAYPSSPGLGDVDGDGDLDFVTLNRTTSATVQLNNGAGTFTGGQTLALRANLAAPVLADVDGDGTLDLVTTDYDTNTATVNLNPAIPFAPAGFRINAGGGAVSTSRGPFGADQYYPTNSRTYSTPAAIAGTSDPALYQTERYSTDGMLRYAVPVPNGSYSVVLHFAEIYWKQPGQRVFDVALEGQKVLDNYDIAKKVGANTATTETFATIVTDGVLNLDLSALYAGGGVDQAKLSALEVLPVPVVTNQAPMASAGVNQILTLPTNSTTLQGSGMDAYGTIVGYAWTQVQGPNTATSSSPTVANLTISSLIPGNYVFSLVVTDNNGTSSAASQVAVTVYPATTTYRINAGGGAVSTTRGLFAADQYYSTSSNTFVTSAPIAGTADPALYQNERYSTHGLLSYALPISNGTYTVVLHFAEIYWKSAGQRVFDVALEGQKVLDHYDIVRKVGPNTATTETFTATVSDGLLNLDLSALYPDGGVDQAKLSALEVFSSTDPAVTYRVTAPLAAKALANTLCEVSVYPNPSAGRFMLSCTASKAQAATLTLTDGLGRVVLEQQVQLQAGANQVLVQADHSAQGLYQLALRTADGQRRSQKVSLRP